MRYLDGEVLGAQIFRAARRLFGRLAERRPLVVVVEDLHWADASSRALLQHLLPLARALPVLFVVLSRPDSERIPPLRETAERELPARFDEIALLPLSVAESQQLLVAVLGEDERLSRLRDRILYTVEGNPFFLEEVVRELIDSRVLVRAAALGTWSVQDQDIVIPQTIEGVLMARIDRLDERLREVLGIAAVIGRTFLYRVLRAVSDVDVDEPLAKLTVAELVEPLLSAPELAHLFRHALTHQVVYESLLLDKRRQLHARVAELLEGLHTGRLHEVTSLLAFHYTRAQNSERALHYLVEAAEQSTHMAADGEALAFYEEAVASYWRGGLGDESNKPQHARIEWRLGEIYFRRGDHARAEEHLVRAIGLFGDRIPTGRLARVLAITHEIIQHVINLLLQVGRKPKVIGEADANAEAHIRPYELLAWTYFLSGHKLLLLLILRSANIALRMGSVEYVAKSLSALGWSLTMRGHHRIASRYYRSALSAAEQFGNPAGRALLQFFTGTHLFVIGRWREAEQDLEAACTNADRIGELLIWSGSSNVICEIWNETADFARVLDLSDRMITRGRESAFQPALRWGLLSRGKALRRAGRLQEAYPVLDEAFRLAVAENDIIAASHVGGDLGMALLSLGRGNEAERILGQLRWQIAATGIRVFSVCGVYTASAELALRRVEAGAPTKKAVRACAETLRVARTFSMARPAALRLEGRLAWLRGRSRRAERLWTRAAAVAEALGARYELGLIQEERYARTAARNSARSYGGDQPAGS